MSSPTKNMKDVRKALLYMYTNDTTDFFIRISLKREELLDLQNVERRFARKYSYSIFNLMERGILKREERIKAFSELVGLSYILSVDFFYSEDEIDLTLSEVIRNFVLEKLHVLRNA